MHVNTFKYRIAAAAAAALDFILRLVGSGFYSQVVKSLSERQPSGSPLASSLDVEIHCPSYVSPDPANDALVERIFQAYGKAKADQPKREPVFAPSSLWQEHIEMAYASLVEGHASGDMARFHHFLANFGVWETYTGIESTDLVRQHAADADKRTVFEQQIIAPMVRWWTVAESGGRPLSALSYPRFGNQCGAIVDGHFIGAGSVFNDVFAANMARLVQGRRPVVAEIGGGYGKLFYFLSRRLNDFCYVDLDLPETLACASYYLLKSFPDKKFLLYGEGGIDRKSLDEFDFILFPSFEITSLPDRSVELFVNKNSLGEMAPDLCRLFVKEICRTTEYFWHMNHEFVRNSFGDGTASLLNAEYPVAEDEFQLLVRGIDVGHPVSKGKFNYDSDIYFYTYKRR